MGDRIRNTVFADFVGRNFPRANRVLCVADGKGELATILAFRYDVTVIDPKPRGNYKKLNYIKGFFDHHFVSENYDVILGMHPDEATAEILLNANKYNKPFATIPCCIKGSIRFTHGISNFNQWLKTLKRICNCEVNETMLKFSGKNVVLYRR